MYSYFVLRTLGGTKRDGCGTNPCGCCGSCVAPPRARPPPRRIARFRSLRHKLAAWLDGTPQTGASVTDGPRRGSPASPFPWSGCGPHRVGQSEVARMRPRVGIPLIPEDPGIKTSDRVHRGRVPTTPGSKGSPKRPSNTIFQGVKTRPPPLENRRMGGKRQPKVLSPRRPSAPRKNPAKTGVCPASVPLCPTIPRLLVARKRSRPGKAAISATSRDRVRFAASHSSQEVPSEHRVWR